jgi:hypothetical protein
LVNELNSELRGDELDAGGDVIPSDPAEAVVAVDLIVGKVSAPNETVIFRDELDNELDAGGDTTPSEPVEDVIAVDPPTEKVSAPDEIVTFGNVELDAGGDITPAEPVEDVVAIDPPVEKVSAPDGTVTFGNELDAEGEMTPPEPVELVVTVNPPFEKVTAPDDTVTFGNDTNEELGSTLLEILDGRITPSEPVEDVNAVDPPVEKTSLPPKTETLTSALGVALEGEMTPPEPAEMGVEVLLSIVTIVLSSGTDSESVGAELGVMAPCEPVLVVNAVPPDSVKADEPTETVTRGRGALEEMVGYVQSSTLGPYVFQVSNELGIAGKMTPPLPVEMYVYVDPSAVDCALPSLTLMLVFDKGADEGSAIDESVMMPWLPVEIIV